MIRQNKNFFRRGLGRNAVVGLQDRTGAWAIYNSKGRQTSGHWPNPADHLHSSAYELRITFTLLDSCKGSKELYFVTHEILNKTPTLVRTMGVVSECVSPGLFALLVLLWGDGGEPRRCNRDWGPARVKIFTIQPFADQAFGAWVSPRVDSGPHASEVGRYTHSPGCTLMEVWLDCGGDSCSTRKQKLRYLFWVHFPCLKKKKTPLKRFVCTPTELGREDHVFYF